MDPTLRIRLFGKFYAAQGDQVLTGLDARKIQELFCYLLLYRDRPHPRETLAGHLWGESSTVQSKKALRQAIWHLQSALDGPEGAPRAVPILLVDPEWISINPAADIELDVCQFEEICTELSAVLGVELTVPQAEQLRAAVELYQDDLLIGCYQDWCLFERERLQNLFLAVLEKLVSYCEMQHDYAAGMQYGERILRIDRAHERTHRRMMRMLYLQGDRTSALRQYQRCVATLDADLGVGPTERTQQLYRELAADTFDPATSTVSLPLSRPANGGSNGNHPLLPGMLVRLRKLQLHLAHLQVQLDQDIKTLEAETGETITSKNDAGRIKVRE